MKRPDRALSLYERALDSDPTQVELTDRVNYLLTKGAAHPRQTEPSSVFCQSLRLVIF